MAMAGARLTSGEASVRLRGHSKEVWSLLCLPGTDIKLTSDSKQSSIPPLFSGALDGTIRVWDITNKNCVHVINAHPRQSVYSLISFSTTLIGSGSTDGVIKFWELSTKHNTQTLTAHDAAVFSLALIPKATQFVSQSVDTTLKIWDYQGTLVRTIQGGTDYISTIVVTKDGMIIGESNNCMITKWDPRSPNATVIGGHGNNHMRALAMIDDFILGSGSQLGDIKLWDIRRNTGALKTLTGHTNCINAIIPVTQDMFASAAGDKSIRLWDAKDYKCTHDMKDAHDDWIQALVRVNDDMLASGSGDKTIGLHSLSRFPVLDVADSKERASSPRALDSSTGAVITTMGLPRVDSQSHVADRVNDRTVTQHLYSGGPSRNYIFYFKRMNGNLTCVIRANEDDFDPHFIDNIINTLRAFNIVSICSPIVTIDFTKTVEINFRQINSRDAIYHILKFIRNLNDLRVRELHENVHALWFYANNGGDEILNHQNYPAKLKRFLAQEQKLFTDFVKSTKSNLVIEVGCGELENVEVANANNVSYLGLDFSPQRISKVQDKLRKGQIKKLPGQRVNVKCVNIIKLDSGELELLPADQPVMIFPFNVIGNVAPISALFTNLRLLNMSMLISIYKNDAASIAMRREYYESCEYKHIQMQNDPNGTGVVFRSDEGLYTVAYDQSYLVKLLSAIGFNVIVSDEKASEYGHMLCAQPRNDWKENLSIQNSPATTDEKHRKRESFGSGLSPAALPMRNPILDRTPSMVSAKKSVATSNSTSIRLLLLLGSAALLIFMLKILQSEMKVEPKLGTLAGTLFVGFLGQRYLRNRENINQQQESGRRLTG